MDKLAGWGRFCLFIGANILALAALYLVLFRPAWDFVADQRARIEDIGPRLEQARASLDRGRAVLSLDPELSSAAERFVQGETLSIRNADLLTRLRKLGEEHGLSFSSVATLPERDWQGRKLVGARVEFSGTTRRVADLVLAVESGRSYLFISRAQLSPSSERDGTADTIGANLEIYGVSTWPRA
jgi:hypothetical protein